MSPWSGTVYKGLSRREFCGMGAVLAGCACAPRALALEVGRPDLEGRDSLYTGVYPLDIPEDIVLSTCLGCHGACPVRISRHDAILGKMDGNPWSPRVHAGVPPVDAPTAARSRGTLCARGQARLQNTHDPFRLVRPLVRSGPRGSGAWTTTEKTSEILAKGFDQSLGLEELASHDWNHSTLLAVDPRQLDRASLLMAFQEAVGAEHCPRILTGDPQPWVAAATERLVGQPGLRFAPHWDRARSILIWGADPFSSGPDPVGDSREINRLCNGRHGIPLVVVDPRLSEVATKADIWLPVKPGGDRALAWMFLRVWAEEGRFAVPADWMRPISALPWSDLERRSGLGQEIVRKAALLVADDPAGLAMRVGGGVGERPDGVDAAEAILRLAVVAGATGPGGAMTAQRVVERPGQRPQDALGRDFPSGRLPALLVVVGDGGLPDTPEWPMIKGFLEDPKLVGFLVVISTTLNPVAALADLVIPDLTEMERNGVVIREDGISKVEAAVPSVLAQAGLPAPWDRGLDGFLEVLSVALGTPVSVPDLLLASFVAADSGSRLATRGWVPPADDGGAAPVGDPYQASANMDPGAPIEGLPLVTWRPAFAGFTDSSAQYWSQPSLVRRNAAWIHPSTAAQLGIRAGQRVSFKHGSTDPGGLAATGAILLAPVKITEEIRPGVVGLAVGFGHAEGVDGATTIDGVALPGDRRRSFGVDVGAVWRAGPSVEPTPAPAAPARSVLDLLRHGLDRRDRV